MDKVYIILYKEHVDIDLVFPTREQAKVAVEMLYETGQDNRHVEIKELRVFDIANELNNKN